MNLPQSALLLFHKGVAIWIVLAIAPARAAPITFLTALPVHESGFLFRAQGFWMRMNEDPSSLDREMNVIAAPLAGVYGATSKLALMGVVPFLYQGLEIGATGAFREAAGLGDILTLARYEVFERSRPARTLRAGLFGGVKWPTGEDRETDAAGVLPRPVQVGSGSYDFPAGAVLTGQWLFLQVDADFLYQRKNPSGGFKSGDLIQEDISFQYRLWPKSLQSQGVPNFVYGVLEANSVFRFRDEADGVEAEDTGGYILFITPGAQWVSQRVVFEMAVQIPALQDLNGNALETDFALMGGFRVWY